MSKGEYDMRRLLENVLRYKKSFVFVLIGQIVIYISVFGILNLYNNAENREKDRIESIYDSRIEIDLYKSQEKNIFSEDFLNIDRGNIVVTKGLSLSFSEQGLPNIVDLVLVNNEELPYKLIKGHIPGTEESDIGRNVVAIGRDKLKYAYEENGKQYITLATTKYEVVGVLGSNRSDFWDYKIVLNIHCISDKTLESINKDSDFKLELGSNNIDIFDIYKDVYVSLMSEDNGLSLESNKVKGLGESTVSKTLNRTGLAKKLSVALFCLCNCLVISEFFFIEHRKELEIEKTLGASNRFVIGKLFTRYTEISAIALLLFLIVTKAFEKIGLLSNIIRVSFINVLVVFATIIVIAILSLIYPYVKVVKMDIVEMRTRR